MRLGLFLGSLLFLGFADWVEAKNCSALQLKRQDCRLQSGTYKLRLLRETVARDDGTWKMVDTMPLKDEGVQWEKVSFDIFAGRPILQLWIWDTGQGEAAVQSLHWFIVDVEKKELQILEQDVVRRRRVKVGEGGELEKTKPVFAYDKTERHSLKLEKSGLLVKTLGWNKKVIEKVIEKR